MKKNIIRLLLISALASLAVSCSLFTTSLGKGAARDLSAKFEKASTSELVDMLAGSGGVTLSNSEAKAAINALSQKSESELKGLNGTQTSAVLNTAASAIIPTSVASNLIDTITKDQANTDTKAIFNTILGSIDTGVDTKAVVTLLNSPGNVNAANSDAIVIATAALIGSMVKESGKSYTDLETNLQNIGGANMDTTARVADALNKALNGSNTANPPTPEMTAVANILLAVNGQPQGDYKAITDLPFDLKF